MNCWKIWEIIVEISREKRAFPKSTWVLGGGIEISVDICQCYFWDWPICVGLILEILWYISSYNGSYYILYGIWICNLQRQLIKFVMKLVLSIIMIYINPSFNNLISFSLLLWTVIEIFSGSAESMRYLHSFREYLIQTLVFMWNSALRRKFNFYVLGVFG